jgi:Reverse transcriptase-like/SWIM zinc finger
MPRASQGDSEPIDALVEAGRYIYTAGAVAVTEPGPAAAGVVVADERGRMLAHRSHYLGNATRPEATARALLIGIRFALGAGMQAPTFRVDDADLVRAVNEGGTLPDRAGLLVESLRETAEMLPDARVELISAGSNRARAVALAPLVDWLPERTRRAEELAVHQVGPHEYEVSSGTKAGKAYKVVLRDPRDNADPAECDCSDFQYRGIPCKHLLAVAREAGLLERLFYSDRAEARS